MAIPVATALGKHDRMWPAVALSLAAHVLLVVWALARRPPPPIDLEQRPIVAKLVRLGEKKPEAWLPRKDAQPPPPAPPAVAPAPVAATAPAKPAVPAPNAPPRPAPPSAGGKPGGTSLASILSKVQRQQVADSRYGSPDGDAAGDSDSASEGDRYLALVVRELRSRYRVPATISDRDRLYLKGTLVLYIEPDGRITRWRFESRSGNGAFDDALERTLRQTRLPPPPTPMRELYRVTGLQVTFQIG